MADSTLAALGALATVEAADSSYIEEAGVAKKVAESVKKTFYSLSPALITPDLGVPSAGDISACTGGPTLTSPTFVTPALGTPASGVLDNCTGGPTLTSPTLVTPALGVVASGDISACTGTLTSLTLVTPALGTPASGVLDNCTGGPTLTSPTFVTPALGTPASGVLDNCTGGPTLTSPTLVTPALGTPASGVLDNCTGAPVLTLAKRSVEIAITADVGSVQGGSPITKDINEISICANTGDAITLPAAVAGLFITIINNGANSSDVFPASGDNLGAGANSPAALAATANITYLCIDATVWFPMT